MLISEDLDKSLTQYLRGKLSQKYPSIFVGRNFTENQTRTLAVLVQRSGGPFLDLLRDQAHCTVNIHAASEEQANTLAREVRSYLEDLDRKAFRRVQVSGPSPVDGASTPQRFMSLDLIARRRKT